MCPAGLIIYTIHPQPQHQHHFGHIRTLPPRRAGANQHPFLRRSPCPKRKARPSALGVFLRIGGDSSI
eukprot:scaffold5586_cov124-Isochrysis_galbana.AAC.1